MIAILERLDRRIVFLLMGLAVALPILFPLELDYRPSKLALDTFNAIDGLPDGSKVVFSVDYDPCQRGRARTHDERDALSLREEGPQALLHGAVGAGTGDHGRSHQEHLAEVSARVEYGTDYVELGYQAGNQGVIKIAATDLHQQFKTDRKGTPLKQIPMMKGIASLQNMDLLITVSAGFPARRSGCSISCRHSRTPRW
jgi:hypothetical protein